MMDNKRKIKLEKLNKRVKPAIPTTITLDSKKFIDTLENKMSDFSELLKQPLSIGGFDELLTELSGIGTLSKEVAELRSAISEVKTPEYPKEVKIVDVEKLVSLLRVSEESNEKIKINSDKLKAVIEAVENLSSTLAKNSANKSNPGDFIPVRRVVKVGNGLVFDDNPTSMSSRGGGSSVDTTGLATSAKQDEIITALGSVGGGTQYTEGDTDVSFTGLMSLVEGVGDTAVTLKQPTQPTDTQPISAASLPLPTGAATSALQTQLESLVDTLQELVQRLSPLAGAMNNTAQLRVIQTAVPSTAVTGPITSAQSIAEKAVAGISYTQRVAIENNTAIQSNINNAVA